MQTDITVWTSKGPVVLAITGTSFFDLKGDAASIEEIQAVVPVLQAINNPLEFAGDAIGRLVYLQANDLENNPTGRFPNLVSHQEMQDDTLTENPIVLFQVIKEIEVGSELSNSETAEYWETLRVFIDPKEAQGYVNAQPYRYKPEDEDTKWRFYTGIAEGTLKRVVKEARDIANL